MSFKNEVRNIAKTYKAKADEARKTADDYMKNNRDIAGSDRYGAKLRELNDNVRQIVNEGCEKISEVGYKYGNKIEERYLPKGSEMTEDAGLFTSGLTFSKDELALYADKYKDNMTMIRIIKKHIENHKKEYGDKMNMIKGLEELANKDIKLSAISKVCTYCRQSITDEVYYNEIIMNDAHFDRACGEELANE